jgi:hypothetical protein
MTVGNSSTTNIRPAISIGLTSGQPVNCTLRIYKPTLDNGYLWAGTLQLPNGTMGQVIWLEQAGGSSTTYYTSYGHYMGIDGVAHAVSGGVVTLTNSPMLLYP